MRPLLVLSAPLCKGQLDDKPISLENPLNMFLLELHAHLHCIYCINAVAESELPLFYGLNTIWVLQKAFVQFILFTVEMWFQQK